MSNESVSCYHCQTPCDKTIFSDLNGDAHYFCCHGCKAITDTIFDQGLGQFYRHREIPNAQAPTEEDSDFAAYDLDEIQEEFVVTDELGKRVAHLLIRGITCAACVWLIEQQLNRLPGVESVRVNASSHRAAVTFQPATVNLSKIFAALRQIGYQAQPLIQYELEHYWQSQQRLSLIRLGVAGIGMMQSGMVALALHAGAIQGMEANWQWLLRWVNLAFTLPVILFSARPFFGAAWRAVKARHLVMDVSVSLALVLAFGASLYATVTSTGDVYFDSICMFTFFLLLGRYFEQRARWRNNQSNGELRQLLPLTAHVVSGKGHSDVPLKQVRVAQCLRVFPGEVVPVDGIVVSGESEVDEAIISGESIPVIRRPGDRVLAGSHNGGTQLDVEVVAMGPQTHLAKIESLVIQAEQQKPFQAQLADRLAGKFVAIVLLTALITFIGWWQVEPSKALWVALSVLVVTCPCALSLATPTVLTVAVNRLKTEGVLITGANALENMRAVDTVIFDKTGTLTDGRMAITACEPLVKRSVAELLELAAVLEQGSRHPIAAAFAGVASELSVSQRRDQVGAGISGVVAGQRYRIGLPSYAWPNQTIPYPSEGLWLLLASEFEPLAWFKLEDQLRSTAFEVVQSLRQFGLKTVLLSGDRPDNVQHIAEKLAIDEWHGGLLPQHKLNFVQALHSGGHRVLMVGDGLNDLPVISGADVSCAMGSSTNLTRTKADAVLLYDQLEGVVLLSNVAKLTKRKIVQNLGWAAAYNVLALPLAISGFVPPWAAAVGMSLSSVLVVSNALHLNRAAIAIGAQSGVK